MRLLCLGDSRRQLPLIEEEKKLEKTTIHQRKTPTALKWKTKPAKPNRTTHFERQINNLKNLDFRGTRTPSPIRKNLIRKKTEEKKNLLTKTKTTINHYEGEGGSHSIFRGKEENLKKGRVKEFVKFFEGTKEHTNGGKKNVGEALKPNSFCTKYYNPFVTATQSQDSYNQSDDPYQTRPRQKRPQERLALRDWPGGGQGDGLQRIREGDTRARDGGQI